MRKVIHKLFLVWNYEKEEAWLNEMAAQGLALVAVGFCRYEFEDCVPGEYKIALDYLYKSRAENQKYVEFLEDTGAEHVGTIVRWTYFRKKTAEPFSILSDNCSKIALFTRIMRMLLAVMILNLYAFCLNIGNYFSHREPVFFLSFINLFLVLVLLYGYWRFYRKRKKLKEEQNIFEG